MDRTFYQRKDCTDEERFDLVDKAVKIAKSVRVDELDCNRSYFREPTDMTVEEFKEHYKNAIWKFWTYMIDRDFFGEEIAQIFCRMKEEYKVPDHDESGDFEWLRNHDLFLWIDMPMKDGWKLFKKYKLKVMK